MIMTLTMAVGGILFLATTALGSTTVTGPGSVLALRTVTQAGMVRVTTAAMAQVTVLAASEITGADPQEAAVAAIFSDRRGIGNYRGCGSEYGYGEGYGYGLDGPYECGCGCDYGASLGRGHGIRDGRAYGRDHSDHYGYLNMWPAD